MVLYWMLQQLGPNPATGPKNLMQGGVEDVQKFRSRLQRFHDEETLDAGLVRAFKHAIRDRVRDERLRRVPTLKQRYRDLCQRFGRLRTHVSKTDRDHQSRFIGDMRALLARTCINALQPDLPPRQDPRPRRDRHQQGPRELRTLAELALRGRAATSAPGHTSWAVDRLTSTRACRATVAPPPNPRARSRPCRNTSRPVFWPRKR